MANDLMSLEQLKKVLERADEEATIASQTYLKDALGGRDQFPCGFAWVNILGFKGQKINGNTKMGKLLKEAGITQNYGDRKFQLWCPGRGRWQNVYVIEQGAAQAALVLATAGFDTEIGSKWD
jgi:hypothetical protein